jgi:N-methylhydantoinase A
VAPVAEYKVSADVGGTFTDVAVSDLAGALRLGKALSTPDEPFRGVTEALTEAAAGFGLAADGDERDPHRSDRTDRAPDDGRTSRHPHPA